MEIKEAVQRAKEHITELFTDEGAKQIGLEEIEYDRSARAWRVTVGFSRAWDHGSGLISTKRGRDMKVVTLKDTDGTILSVKNRE